ncbi:MAG: hypothetical protein WCE79_04365 [Xanthobacteraceae bacterium]
MGAAALAAAMCVTPVQPARAQFGISIGGFPIGVHFGRGYRGGRYGRRHRGPKDDSQSQNVEARAPKEDKVAASKGAPSSKQQMDVLRVLVASTAVSSAVGSTKDLFEVGQTTSNEADRDYTAKIAAIITRFNEEQENANNNEAGDISMTAIEQSLEKAFKNAKLDVYGRFAGESWTSDRMRKMILDLADAELSRLFRGNTKGTAPMSALDALIQRAGESVYRRIFETSELLAANRSAALFMQRLYQTHGKMVKDKKERSKDGAAQKGEYDDDDVMESADGIISRAALGVIRPYETAMRRSDNAYVYRYRAQRIVFDCLSEQIVQTTSSETGRAEKSVIEHKITAASNDICSKWLLAQFGAPTGELQSQQPYPLRAVWSNGKLKDNPAMYNNSLGTF